MADLNIPPTIEGLRVANRRLAKLLAKERQRAESHKRERDSLRQQRNDAWAHLSRQLREYTKLRRQHNELRRQCRAAQEGSDG